MRLTSFSLSFLLSLMLMASCSVKQAVSQSVYPDHVGDIAFDPALDDSSFHICHPKVVPQYYAFASEYPYKGGKPAILNRFRKQYEPIKGVNGYLTIRFMVNCEGKTGRFRIQEMTLDMKATKFPTGVSDRLLTLTRELEDWQIFSQNGVSYDHYRYLTFKLIDGNIAEILP